MARHFCQNLPSSLQKLLWKKERKGVKQKIRRDHRLPEEAGVYLEKIRSEKSIPGRSWLGKGKPGGISYNLPCMAARNTNSRIHRNKPIHLFKKEPAP
ncbi:MAG: hypothetical protein AMJ94_02565 [Deltaproteobacteria bacterium SM23_61]|nr:MAG: hypothetical protein AMJ94_02565 [Deltaproteobacteria bacterium SM23_61]